MFSALTIVAIIGSILLLPQMVNATESEDTSLTSLASDTPETTIQGDNEIVPPSWNNDCKEFGRIGMRGRMRGFGGFGPIEFSEEFEQSVISIAESDTDVQDLITEGYDVSAVRPIVKNVIDAEGNMVTKATNAVLTLQKDTTGYATVIVDIEETNVARIIILTRTVIDKT